MTTKDFRDAAFGVVHDLMRADPHVVVLANDLGAHGLDKIREEFPARTINVGVAEQNMMSLAGGLAESGKRVFVYGIISHLMRGWEQIKVGLCIPNLPVTIIGLGAGLSSGLDGPTHYGTEDVALMRVLSNMTIYNPADCICTAAAIQMAYDSGTPHYIRLDKEQLPALYSATQDFNAGYCVWGDGRSTIISTGVETWRARQVDQAVRVIDVFRLKPAPDIGRYLQGSVAVWDEHHPHGGLYSIVAEMLCPALRKTLPDQFLPATKREPVLTKPLAMVDDGYGYPANG